MLLESAYLNYSKNSSCRLLCINALPIYHIILSIESKASMYLNRNSIFGFAIGFTEISRVNEQNEQVHNENFFGG